MNSILGFSASNGLGIGKAYVLPEVSEYQIEKRSISSEEVAKEWKRFDDSCATIQQRIEEHIKNLPQDSVQRSIFETNILMLTDPVFSKEVKSRVEKENLNIEYILKTSVEEYVERLRNSGNDYLAERARDIEDVFTRVLYLLVGYKPFDIMDVPDGSIIVAKSMRTSDSVVLSKKKIAGIALTEGGVSSHVAILSKSYGIPAVMGIPDIAKNIHSGDEVIVDGALGQVIINPDAATRSEYQIRIAAEAKYQLKFQKFRDKKATTEDGTEFKIYANIGTPEEAEIALNEGADGIGLFRTEFLFMNEIQKLHDKGSPFASSVSEELQFEAYKKVLETMGDRPVTIRTLDAGGDKHVKLDDIPQLVEKNPLMGLRAIRMSLFYPKVFRTQLRALYRASVYGNLRIMLPLITNASQVETVLGIARGVQMSLKEDGIPYREDVPIGIMIETAAAAICSDVLAPHCAFFSLGTNDLTQYIIGIDRENPTVAPLYNEFHLAVLRMIEQTIRNAKKANIPVSVCGEMAGRRESAIILAGMGVRSLSMSPKQIPVIKETLSQFTIQELENISSRSLY